LTSPGKILGPALLCAAIILGLPAQQALAQPQHDGGTLRVRVVDDAGAPIAGAAVTIDGPSPATATTAADGTFSIALERGSYTYVVRRPGFREQRRPAYIIFNRTTAARVVLPREGISERGVALMAPGLEVVTASGFGGTSTTTSSVPTPMTVTSRVEGSSRRTLRVVEAPVFVVMRGARRDGQMTYFAGGGATIGSQTMQAPFAFDNGLRGVSGLVTAGLTVFRQPTSAKSFPDSLSFTFSGRFSALGQDDATGAARLGRSTVDFGLQRFDGAGLYSIRVDRVAYRLGGEVFTYGATIREKSGSTHSRSSLRTTGWRIAAGAEIFVTPQTVFSVGFAGKGGTLRVTLGLRLPLS
jgi:hypothetical protein